MNISAKRAHPRIAQMGQEPTSKMGVPTYYFGQYFPKTASKVETTGSMGAERLHENAKSPIKHNVLFVV